MKKTFLLLSFLFVTYTQPTLHGLNILNKFNPVPRYFYSHIAPNGNVIDYPLLLITPDGRKTIIDTNPIDAFYSNLEAQNITRDIVLQALENEHTRHIIFIDLAYLLTNNNLSENDVVDILHAAVKYGFNINTEYYRCFSHSVAKCIPGPLIFQKYTIQDRVAYRGEKVQNCLIKLGARISTVRLFLSDGYLRKNALELFGTLIEPTNRKWLSR